jgi:hypothetical protein
MSLSGIPIIPLFIPYGDTLNILLYIKIDKNITKLAIIIYFFY